MKISIVIPVYNVSKYLEHCVNSIINQTIEPYEIILVDDGSTDKSGDMCDEFSLKYGFIRVVHKKNAGLGLARNTGIENAKGDFIVFIDSDDYADEELLQYLYTAHTENNSDTCLGGYKRVDHENRFISKSFYEPTCYKGDEVFNYLIPRIVGSAPDASDCIAMSSVNVMYSMGIILKYDLKFVSERILISEDIIFNLNYYKYASNVSLIEQCSYNYRANPGTLTTKYRDNRFEMVKTLYDAEVEILKDLGIYDICQYRLMRQLFIYLRMCFAQENPKISNKTIIATLKCIHCICSDSLVQNVIKSYPKKHLGIQQRAFLYFVKFKCSMIIYLFIRIGVLSVL